MPQAERGNDDKAKAAKPGDEAPAGTPGTGEALCHDCGGSGTLQGAPCRTCAGTGIVTQGIGGA